MGKISIVFVSMLFLFFNSAYADQNDYSVGRAAGYNDGLNTKLNNLVKMHQNSEDTITMANLYYEKTEASNTQETEASNTQETESSVENSNQDEITIPEPSYISEGKSVQYQNGYKFGWKEGYIKGYKDGSDGGNEGFLLGRC